MAGKPRNEFHPDYITPPCETLQDTIDALGMKQVDLARRIGRSPKAVNEVFKGEAAISPEMAILLERALGVPASFWNNRQRRYDEFMARQAAERRMKKDIHWLKNFNYSKMAAFGWLEETKDKLERLDNLLNFFGVGSATSWEDHWAKIRVSYRRSQAHKADEYALAAWLRKGELVGQKIECAPYDTREFRKCLQDIRKLTVEPASVYQKKLVDICSACGVAVAFVRELPKTASGATRWLTKDKALIQLSLRYKTDDHFWFTFYHEAGHILMHGKRDIFVEREKTKSPSSTESVEEKEADKFATEFLIPPKAWNEFNAEKSISCAAIEDFARRINIAPGIAVGQLQHKKKLPYSHCNKLKRKLKWLK